MNFLPGMVAGDAVVCGGFRVAMGRSDLAEGRLVMGRIRPEHVSIGGHHQAEISVIESFGLGARAFAGRAR